MMKANIKITDEGLDITEVWADNNKILLYAFCDGSQEEDSKVRDLVEEWVYMHGGIIDGAILRTHTFPTLTDKHNWMEQHKICHLTYYKGNEAFPFTGYEREVYEPTIYRWYESYQDVIIAGQILPNILGDKVPLGEHVSQLRKLTEQMYEKVDNYQSFLEQLSTDYVKRALIRNPIDVMRQCCYDRDQRELFRRQFFKDD